MIKKEAIILIVIFLAVIFQMSFFPLFFSIENIPDFISISLVSLVVIFGFQNVWVWGIIAGLVMDIFSFEKIGISIISLIVSCYIASFFSRRVLLGEKLGGILTGILLVLVITFFNNSWLILADIGFWFQEIWRVRIFFFDGILWKFIFNLILFLILLLILKKLYKKKSSAKNLIIGN